MALLMFLWLSVSSIAFSANSQDVTRTPNIIYPDNIYFDDNRPSVGQPEKRQMNSPSVEFQPPYNVQNLAQIPIIGNVLETSTPSWNIVKPVNEVSILRQPVYELNEVLSRNPDKIPVRSNILPRIYLDQPAVALTNFSLNVMKNVIVRNRGNTVVSPYSIATVLSLLQQGATQQALEQISVALQMSAQTSSATYKAQTLDILSRSSHNILRTANNLFVADAFYLNPEFKVVAQRDFGSEVTSTTFERPEYAAQLINGWVASKTNHKIDHLISADSVGPNTQMVIVNAIYFKGLWAAPFRQTSTKVEAFNLRNGAKKNVPFMMTRRQFRAGIDKQTDAKVVILPFENDEYSMMIILPSIMSNAQTVLASLTVSQLEQYLNFKQMEVALQIPKFAIKVDTDLTPVLKQMGVSQIFDQNSGLVGLGMYRNFSPQVSTAVHSAQISIDEEGSVAAAASAVSVVALSNDGPSMGVRVDRPFVVVLWDEKTKVPLFVAKIVDPSL